MEDFSFDCAIKNTYSDFDLLKACILTDAVFGAVLAQGRIGKYERVYLEEKNNELTVTVQLIFQVTRL